MNDANNTILELNEECDALLQQVNKKDLALKNISSRLYELKIDVEKEISSDDNVLSKDYASFFNAMQAHEVEGYVKNKRKLKNCS